MARDSNQNREVPVTSPARAGRRRSSAPPPEAGEPPLISPELARFLGSIPLTIDQVEWQGQFSRALHRFLGDVDIVALKLNAGCYSTTVFPDGPATWRFVTNFIQKGVRTGRMDILKLNECSDVEYLLHAVKRSGIDLTEGYPPTEYEYYDRGVYLATLLLLRSKKRSPISARTLEAMNALEPFLKYLFMSFSARYMLAHPGWRLASRITDRILDDFNFQNIDEQILLLRFRGYTLKEIGGILHCSMETVAKHVKRIYKVTGCGNFQELFWRYLQKHEAEAPEPAEQQKGGAIIVF